MTKYYKLLWAASVIALLVASCGAPAPQAQGQASGPTRPAVVVTYSLLGSLVADLAGEALEVKVLMPDGLDPHEWEPSAKDIETLNHASLVVRNGLGLEGGLEGALAQAEAAGIPQFTASDHLKVRRVKAGEGLPNGDEDQAVGAADPHLWLDPAQLAGVIEALAADLKARFGTDLDSRAADLAGRLRALDAEVKAQVAQVPPDRRLLVTGHESLGYFAEAQGLTLVGAIVPSLNDQAEVSASDMAALKAVVRQRQVPVLFTELGTPPKVARALGDELHLRVVEITTHALGTQGDYFGFYRTLAATIVGALKP